MHRSIFRYDEYSSDSSSYGSGEYSSGEYSAEGYDPDSYSEYSSGSGEYSTGDTGDYYKEPAYSGDYGYGDGSYKDYPSLKVNASGVPQLPCNKSRKFPGAWSPNVCVNASTGKNHLLRATNTWLDVSGLGAV